MVKKGSNIGKTITLKYIGVSTIRVSTKKVSSGSYMSDLGGISNHVKAACLTLEMEISKVERSKIDEQSLYFCL